MKNKKILYLALLGCTLVSCNVSNSSSSMDNSSESSLPSSSEVSSSESLSENTSSESSSESSSSSSSEQEVETYEISFKTDSSRIIEPLVYEAGQMVSLDDLPILDVRDNLEAPKFVCWTLDNKDVTTEFEMPNKDIELVAKWRAYNTWTIKYETNVTGYEIEDTVISENYGLESYNFPAFNYPYKKVNAWYYDATLTLEVGSTLDETKFVNDTLTLYASVSNTNCSSSVWSEENGVYAGRGYTQVKNTNIGVKKTTSIKVKLPAYNKTTGAYGTTEIYFGGDDELIVDNSVKSGYALFICGLDDNSAAVGDYSDPRAGSMALYKYNKTTNAREMVAACRRYVEPLLSSSYKSLYQSYMTSGNDMEFTIDLVIGEVESYVLVNGTQVFTFDYQPDGDGFGLYTNATYPTAVTFPSISTKDSGKTTVTFDVDGGIGDANTIQVPYGSRLGTLPTLTKENASFKGWAMDTKAIDETYVPGLVETVSLKAQYGEYVPERVVWDGSIATNIATGTGIETDPYVIKSGAELAFVSQQINSQTGEYNKAHYKLGEYLDLNNNAWTPIGLQTFPFQGTFDGNGKSIIGLKVDRAGGTGLFGHIADAYIRNLDVTGTINSTGVNSGILVGRGQISTIENCITRGTLTSNAAYTGAICATVNVYATGVTGTQTKMVIKNCTNYATVSSTLTGSTIIGGILSQNNDTVVTDVVGCVNRGNVNGGANFVGGIIGLARKNENSTIKDCYNYGDISSGTKSRSTGGIAGGTRGKIENCYGWEGAKVNALLGSSTTAQLYPTAAGTTVPGGIICGQWDAAANCTSNAGFVNCGMCDSDGNLVAK